MVDLIIGRKGVRGEPDPERQSKGGPGIMPLELIIIGDRIDQ